MTANTVAAMARLMGVAPPSGTTAIGFGLKVSLKPAGSRAPGPWQGQHVDVPAEELLPFASLYYNRPSAELLPRRLNVAYRDDFHHLDRGSRHGQVRVALKDALDFVGRAGLQDRVAGHTVGAGRARPDVGRVRERGAKVHD